MPSAQTIIFSKDRPAQLDLLLRSLRRFAPVGRELHPTVLCHASSPVAARGYQIVATEHPEDIHFVAEQNFRADLLTCLVGADPLTMFLVDDDVMLRPFNLDLPEVRSVLLDSEIACCSLRLSPSISYCYTKGRATPPPDFLPGRRWEWADMPGDWGYPMSLDGHLYRTEDLVPLVRGAAFTNPTGLENALAEHPLRQPLMICSQRAWIINIPANRVQEVFPNRTMGQDPSIFTERFLAGHRIDLDQVIVDYHGTAVHQEMNLRFRAPPEPPETAIGHKPRHSPTVS